MKLQCIILLLLVTSALCEKKINLEDIEKDLQRAETSNRSPATKKASLETLRAEESKYSTKPEAISAAASSQQHQQSRQTPAHSTSALSSSATTAATTLHHQQYHAPTTSPQELGNQVGDYAELPAYESFKYAPQVHDYGQDAPNEDPSSYLQSPIITSEQQQHQYYPQHQQQQQQQGRSFSDYDLQQPAAHQQRYYQQEVLVGNLLQQQQHQPQQSHQQQQQQHQQPQKTFAPKYVDASDDKETYYINIPTSQLLAYYQQYYQQNYGVSEQKSKSTEPQPQQTEHHHQHQQQQQQQQQPQHHSIPIPAYMLTQSQVYAPTKVTYQPEVHYVSTYPKGTQSMFMNKPTKATPIAATTVTAAAATATPVAHQAPMPSAPTSQPQYATQIEYLANPYHQYYLAHQAQHQQQPQLVFDSAAAYADIYNSAPSANFDHDDNSLYEQPQQQQQQQQHQHQQQHQPRYYVPAALAEQIMAQILQQAGIQGAAEVVHQAVKEMQEHPMHKLASAQYQAQKFHSSVEANAHGDLVPVSGENEGYSAKLLLHSSATPIAASRHQPKTLLDSYVPSHVIAAQDANRERPIKLESGFVPSKVNFIHRSSYKKRKSD